MNACFDYLKIVRKVFFKILVLSMCTVHVISAVVCGGCERDPESDT